MGHELIEIELQYPLVIPAPVLLRLAHFEIFKAGCPHCGGRELEFSRGEMGFPDFSIRTPEPVKRVALFPIGWEDIYYWCSGCKREFGYRFLSPKTPKVSYQEIVRGHIRDLIAFFAENEAISENGRFEAWMETLLLAVAAEEGEKGIPILKWGTEELQRLSKGPSNGSVALKESKLANFALKKILPSVLSQWREI